MRCENCGSEVDDKDVYCGNCGHRIERDYEVVDNHVDDDFIDVTPEEPFQERSNTAGANVANGNAGQTRNGDRPEGGYASDNRNGGYTSYNRNNGNNGYGANMPPRYKAKLSNSSAVISMVCGILSLVGVLSLVTAIIGLNMAKKAQQLIETGEYDGDSYAKAGQICSTIGLVLGIIQVLIVLFTGVLPVILAIVSATASQA